MKWQKKKAYQLMRMLAKLDLIDGLIMTIKVRKNLQNLKPYTSARSIYKQGVFLDNNENLEQWVKPDLIKITDLNRYSDSTCKALRAELSKSYVKGFDKDNIFIGSGSDEIIDLLIRAYVNTDEFIMVMDPTYSMYEIQAKINNVGCKKIKLNPDFQINISFIEDEIAKTKLLFLCSPNNPTGNLLPKSILNKILKFYKGLIIIDEAYIEFAGLDNSFLNYVKEFNNIVIVRTFSKAWGLASIRIGYAIASKEIVNSLLKIKCPYNVSGPSQTIALQALSQIPILQSSIKTTLYNKKLLEKELNKLGIETIPTLTNFCLAKFSNASKIYTQLAEAGIITRDRSNEYLLKNVIRISVGSKKEIEFLLTKLKQIYE